MTSPDPNLESVLEGMRALEESIERLMPAPKVLVVEDDDNDWFMMSKVLDGFYCDVVRVRDGELAVAAIKSGQWSIILLDQKMPTMSGNDVLEATLGLHDGAKVLIVTGMPDSVALNSTLASGAIMIIHKPFTALTAELFLTRKRTNANTKR